MSVEEFETKSRKKVSCKYRSLYDEIESADYMKFYNLELPKGTKLSSFKSGIYQKFNPKKNGWEMIVRTVPGDDSRVIFAKIRRGD